MVDAPIEPQLNLHMINYLDWQREGQSSVDKQRPILLEIMAGIVDSAEGDATLLPVFLGGETVLLSDIATVSDDLLKQFIHSTADKLSIGPWYTYLDGLLANGEAQIRNLLIARADAKRYGVALNTVAFMPNTPQYSAQLPQILKGFGIDTALLSSHYATIPIPFHWQAPDGSSILVINYQEQETAQDAMKTQALSQPDGPFIWIHHITSLDTLASPELENRINSRLDDVAQEVSSRLALEFRPKLKGELYLEPLTETSGRFSGRINQKQAISRLQSQLSYIADPLFALSQVFGKSSFPSIQKSLLDYSWRLLLQSMTQDTFAGAVSDDVNKELDIRNTRIDENSQNVIKNALDNLSGTAYKPSQAPIISDETYITVWNLHGHAVQQIVNLQLNLPESYYPNVLIDPDGTEQAFTWDDEHKVLDFRATVPSVGYVVYTLKISKDKTAAYNQRRTVAGVSIGSASGESLGLTNGRLDWAFANGNIKNLLSYHDGGDAGDIWQYQSPQPDVMLKGSIVDVIQVEATPTYERLIYRNRMRIAAQLKNGQARSRGLRVLDLTTIATYYNELEGIHFCTKFTNPADDHRLRVHLKTGIKAKVIHTDSAFGMVKRSLPKQKQSGELPIQSLGAVYDNNRGLAVFTRGLNSLEVLDEDNQATLALTLLRSVGWLNKSKQVASDNAQMQHDFVNEFMLMPLEPAHDKAKLLKTSLSYRAPLQAIQYSEKPKFNRYSYLELDNDNIVMTALKAPENGQGLLVRLLNSVEGDSGVHLKSREKISQATQLNLAEDHQNDLAIEKKQVNISLEPSQIATIHLKF